MDTTTMQMRETVREMMRQYDAKRAEWLARFGTEEGFAKWFTGQAQGRK